MTLTAKLLAIALSLGIAGAPALAQPGPDNGPDNGRHYDRRGDGQHDGYRRDRGYRGHDRGYRGHRGRRVCRTERHHGQRATRCFYR